MDWARSAYGMILSFTGGFLFPFLWQVSWENDSPSLWYFSILTLLGLLSAGLILVLVGTLSRGSAGLGQAKGLVVMSGLLTLAFSTAVLWSLAAYSDTLAACPTPNSYARLLTRCDMAFGLSVLPSIYGIGLLSSIIALAGSFRVLQKPSSSKNRAQNEGVIPAPEKVTASNHRRNLSSKKTSQDKVSASNKRATASSTSGL